MYNYHLWIVLSESTEESDTGGLAEKIEQLRELVTERVTVQPQDPVNQVNYDWVFQCSASHNHKGDAHQRLESLLAWITEYLPGSFGLVYWNDDEDEIPENSEAFRVLVIARGGITERNDNFLSPIVPTIED